jgi:hypothetical protein
MPRTGRFAPAGTTCEVCGAEEAPDLIITLHTEWNREGGYDQWRVCLNKRDCERRYRAMLIESASA